MGDQVRPPVSLREAFACNAAKKSLILRCIPVQGEFETTLKLQKSIRGQNLPERSKGFDACYAFSDTCVFMSRG